MTAGIVLNHLFKSFQTERRVASPISDFTLKIMPNHLVSILGRSGSGKTTLLRLISGLEKLDRGSITFFDPQEQKLENPLISIVFQEPRLLPWKNVWQNIEIAVRHFSESEKKEMIQQVLHLVQLEGVEKSFPGELSGGMAQRVGLARGIVSRPDILLMDEPFSALDAITRSQLQIDFSRIRQSMSMTTVLITHDVNEAVFLSDEVVHLKDGKVNKTIKVDLPYPRIIDDAPLVELRRALYQSVLNT